MTLLQKNVRLFVIMRFFLYLCAILDKMGILYEKKNFIIANIIFYMRHVLCK